MTPEQFCMWLQGRIDNLDVLPTQAQWDKLKETLSSVNYYSGEKQPAIFAPRRKHNG